ncbi:MAG: hypothetical protein JXA20_05660, partial [Spirochaetes bacterium]|nr:hypothetical protein [Spirochaetota bacterium]
CTMKETKSAHIFDDRDFPISVVRKFLLRVTGIEDVNRMSTEKQIPPGHIRRYVTLVGPASGGAVRG